MNDHLSRSRVTATLKQPTRERTGPAHYSLFGLASDGVYTAIPVTGYAVVSYTAIPPLPLARRFLFCCTILGVTSTGRYPASCPAKPGLSSPAKCGSDHSSHSLKSTLYYTKLCDFCSIVFPYLHTLFRPFHTLFKKIFQNFQPSFFVKKSTFFDKFLSLFENYLSFIVKFLLTNIFRGVMMQLSGGNRKGQARNRKTNSILKNERTQ